MQHTYQWSARGGTNGDDVIILDHENVARSEYNVTNWGVRTHFLWNGEYFAGEGNDTIIRDRPGAYRVGYNGDGDAKMYGGSGTDTISYSHYTGAIDIDLSTADGYGVAKWKGLSGQTIYGVDQLHSIENATGTAFSDLIHGSNGANTLVGGNGNDEIYGEGGDDTVLGGNHNDTLDGGAGNDTLKGESGDDTLKGGDGNDFLYGGAGNNSLWGGNGNDTLWIEGSGRAFGDAGRDILVGGSAKDEMHGGTGNDTLTGLGGNDELYGDDGDDSMLGGDGNDVLQGGNGQDVIHGGNGNDTVVGGAGNDELNGGDGVDTAVWEGSARVVIDLTRVSSGTATQSGYTDTLIGFENFRTGSGNDWISTNGAANVIDSGAGNDDIDAGGGNDIVHAGAGNDLVHGGVGSDSILGEDGDDSLSGEAGNDTLSGGNGQDYVRGGTGTDILYGGNDADQFVFRAGDDGIDAIQDFELGEDMIRFEDFLADAPGVGESYAGRVYAVSTDSGHSTTLVAMTDDGWQAFAKLVGQENAGAVNAAIADGSLFNPSPLNNGGAPGWFEL